jgi:hypothetical protein
MQSVASMHALSSPQGRQSEPPQSMSVSVPLRVPSVQAAGTHLLRSSEHRVPPKHSPSSLHGAPVQESKPGGGGTSPDEPPPDESSDEKREREHAGTSRRIDKLAKIQGELRICDHRVAIFVQPKNSTTMRVFVSRCAQFPWDDGSKDPPFMGDAWAADMLLPWRHVRRRSRSIEVSCHDSSATVLKNDAAPKTRNRWCHLPTVV